MSSICENNTPRARKFAVVDVTDRLRVVAWANDLLAPAWAARFAVKQRVAVMNANAPLWQVPADEIDAVIDVNIKGVANVIRVSAGDDRGETRRGGQLQFRLGSLHVAGCGAVLCDEVGDRGANTGARPGVAEGHGRGAAQSRHHRHGHAAQAVSAAARQNIRRFEEWAETAAPFLLKLGPRDYGRPATVS